MKIGPSPIDAAYAASIKPIRNQMRKFDYQSLLNVMLVYLNEPVSDTKQEMQRLPWVVERLLIWLFADDTSQYKAKIAHESDLRKLIDLAWRNFDKVYSKDKKIQPRLFLRQAILPQAPYQMGLDSHAYLLQLHLLSKLQNNSNLRIFLNQKAGMPIDEYFEMGLLYWTHSINERPWFNSTFVKNLSTAFPIEKQAIFLKSISQPLAAFQTQLRSRTIKTDEWFQPTFFYKTPCIWQEAAAVPLGRPTLQRYFNSLIGDWIAESKMPDIRQHYDSLIERYVGDSLTRGNLAFIPEVNLKALLPQSKLVDFLVPDGDSIILIEVKNKALSIAVPASQEPLEIASKLRQTILKAKRQLDAAELALRQDSKYANKLFFRIVVTNNDLWINNAELLIEDETQEPFTWLISLRELDMLTEITTKKEHSIASVLMQYAEKQKDSLSASSSLEDFLQHQSLKPDQVPAHLLKYADAIFEKIADRLLL